MQITTASFNVGVGTGTYYVIYDNTFSAVSSKNVAVYLNLDWEG